MNSLSLSEFKQDVSNHQVVTPKCNSFSSMDLLSPPNIGLMSTAKSLSPRSFAFSMPPPDTLILHKSIGATKGSFITEVMTKIEHGNSLDLSKVSIKKENVGRGGDAFVHYALFNENKEIALKEYKFKAEEFTEQRLGHFQNELTILESLKHENIIGFLGYNLNIRHKELKFAFEYCHHGNLFNFIHPINKQIQYQYNDILSMILDIAKGMKYLHSKRIIHRDLNPRNVLIFDGKSRSMKITDFGESLLIDSDKDFENPGFMTDMKCKFIGTAGYVAPEIIKIDRKTGYNYKVDVFGFGSLCFELFTKQFVSGKKELKNYQSLMDFEQITLIPEDCPDAFGTLIYECWQFDADKRPTFDKIVKDLQSMIKTEIKNQVITINH